MRRRGRVDDNQLQIVSALRSAGCTVTTLANVGGGCPDLLVGRAGETHLLEVKNRRSHSRRKGGALTTPEQDGWMSVWKGRPVEIVHNIDEALEAVGAIL